MENGDGNENPLQKPLKSPHNAIDDDHQLLEGTKISRSSSSSGLPSTPSSSSSSSCFEDQSINREQSQHSPSNVESLSCQEISAHTPQWSMMSGSPSNVSSFPKNQSHQTQSTGYDPSRIPLTVFDTKSNATVDWSVASTESLFSIHMGNNSFSRDHDLLQMNNKSGDLTTFSEVGTAVFSSEATNKQNIERKSFSSALPPVMEGAPDNEEKIEHTSEALQVQQESNVIKGPKPVDQKQKSQDNRKIVASCEIHSFAITSNKSDERGGTATCLNAPRLSDESGACNSSFAFPLLVNDGGNTASLKSVPEKAEPEQQSQPAQVEPGSSKEVSRAVENNWFSYFFCLRRCS